MVHEAVHTRVLLQSLERFFQPSCGIWLVEHINQKTRIETHRAAPLVVKVVDSAGKPVSGVSVSIDQKASDYQFASAFHFKTLLGKQEYRDHVLNLFSA